MAPTSSEGNAIDEICGGDGDGKLLEVGKNGPTPHCADTGPVSITAPP
jgi:hypothetical protein